MSTITRWSPFSEVQAALTDNATHVANLTRERAELRRQRDELAAAWGALLTAVESDGGTLTVGGIPISKDVRVLAKMHDAGLTKPLVEALTKVRDTISHDANGYEACDVIDAALAPYQERPDVDIGMTSDELADLGERLFEPTGPEGRVETITRITTPESRERRWPLS